MGSLTRKHRRRIARTEPGTPSLRVSIVARDGSSVTFAWNPVDASARDDPMYAPGAIDGSCTACAVLEPMFALAMALIRAGEPDAAGGVIDECLGRVEPCAHFGVLRNFGRPKG